MLRNPQILFRNALAASIAIASLCRCGAGPTTKEIWSETVVGVLGGTIQATQDDGSVAYSRPDLRDNFEKLVDWMNPFTEAIAAGGDCPIVVGATCTETGSNVIRLLNDVCYGKNKKTPVLRRHYVTWKFPNAGTCTDAVTNGFTGTTITNLVGQTVVRGYGYGIYVAGTTDNQNSDQLNFTMASNNEFNAVYTIFPSGWTGDDRVGGVEVTFVDANTRRIFIPGIHAIANKTPAKYTDGASLDLAALGQERKAFEPAWDHTLNTVLASDVYSSAAPSMNVNASGGVAWAGDAVVENPIAPADAYAIVTGYGNNARVAKGAAIRTQHNHSKSVGVSIITEDLVWGDKNCCWPTSGKIHTEFDRFYNGEGKMPWPYEDLSFNAACGSVVYETSEGETGANQLHHCY